MNPVQHYITQHPDTAERTVRLTQAQIRVLEKWAEKTGVDFEDMVGFVVHIGIQDPDEYWELLQ